MTAGSLTRSASPPTLSSRTERDRTCWRWTAVAIVVYLLISVVGLLGKGGPEWFVHFGRKSAAIGLARHVLGPHLVVPHIDGHDGQAFWVLARDPLLLHPQEDAAAQDRPAYRSQRILYPLLAWPWKALGEQGLPWGMLVTNFLVVAAGAWVTTALALDLGAPARASLAWILNPAVLTSFVLDTGDALALLCLVATVLFIRQRRYAAAVVVATFAVLAKEPSLLALGAIALLVPELPVRTRATLVGVPAFAGGLWALYVRWRFAWPASGIQEFTAPLWGYVDAYRRGWSPVGNWADAMVALGVLVFAVVVVMLWRQRRGLLLTAALPFALIVPFFSAQVLDLADNSLRAIGPAITLLALELYRFRPESSPLVAAPARSTAG